MDNVKPGNTFIKGFFVVTVMKVASSEVAYTAVPKSTTVLKGQDITFNCSVENVTNLTSVKWFGPPDFHLRTEGIYSGHPRYSVGGDQGAGQFNLQISNVTHDDAGVYRCWVRELRDNPAEATLTVKDKVASGASELQANSVLLLLLLSFVPLDPG